MSLRLLCLAFGALPVIAFGQIDGTVINATTGKPQAGVVVNLIHPDQDQGGMQTLGMATSGADGTFKITAALPSPPAILRATYQEVEYNMVVPPGSPTSGVKVNVYNVTSQRSESLAQQHLIVLEPGTSGISVNETFLVQNTGTMTYLDPVKGSVQFYVPKAGQDGAKVTITAPLGMPINRAPEKSSQTDVFKIGYPIKPGQTEYDVAYNLPPSKQITGKSLGTGPTLIVTPQTVKLTSKDLKDDGVKQLGQGGPQVQVYEVTATAGSSYEVGVEGTGTVQAGTEDAPPPTEEEGGPPKEKSGPPRLYERLPWVLALIFGMLAVGGTVLYRRSAAL